jgi:predicted amidophosphoribosyltransferase
MPKTNNSEAIKEYCPQCGSQIEYVGKTPANHWAKVPRTSIAYPKYDSATGERMYFDEYKCPNKRWWNNHRHYAFDPSNQPK